MSGYGNKNPPWGRGPGGMPPHLMGVNNDFGGGGMLQQGIPLQQQGMGLAGMAPGMPVTTQGAVGISYPAPRAVNPGGFPGNILQQQQAAVAVMGHALHNSAGPGPGQPSQRVFTGTVTKLHDNFGFVDDDVFFQTSVCKGPVPRVQDRVLVEAAFNPNMPFKWNATRVQVLPNQSAGSGVGPGNIGQGMGRQNQGGPNFQSTNQPGSAFGNEGGPHGGGPGGNRQDNRGGNNERNTRFDGGMRNANRGNDMRGGGNHGNDMRGAGNHGGMRGEMRGNDMDMRNVGDVRGGHHGGNNERQERPPRQTRSPRRRNDRDDRSARDMSGNERNDRTDDRRREWRDERDKDSVPRSSRKRSRSPSRRSRSPARRSRSRSRSPPRRRTRTSPRYNVSVPKISLNFPSSNVMELKKRYGNLYIPSDFFTAKHLWNIAYPINDPFKVQYATSFHVFNKDSVDPPSPNTGPNKWQFDPPDSDYTWVAKVMLLASPNIEDLYEKTCNFVDKDSKDREDLVHPTRALKFLVGLKEKREIMAIGGPWSPSMDGADPINDPTTLIKTAIRTCGALTGIDLSACTKWTKFLQIHYRRQLTNTKPARTETVVIFFPDVWSVMPNKLEYDNLCEQYSQACKMKQEGKMPTVCKEESSEVEAVTETTIEEEDMEVDGEAEVKKGEPSHWASLDPKTMKVEELRGELEVRNQLAKGLKSQLQARLQKCLKSEQDAEEQKETVSDSDKTAEVDGDKKVETEKENSSKEENSEEVTVVLDERQKEKISSYYKTPSNPCIFVHPNTKAKSGKFDCRVESLSVLLDYRTEDNKEGTFEVSLFAELFNEMFLRDSAFKIYKAICNAPDKPKEKKEDKKEETESEKSENKEEVKDETKDEIKEEAKNVEEKREPSIEITEEKEKIMVTKDKDLLLGCSYFDLSHCGYIESKDVEDILFPLELDLSRAEIKKLASKLAVKDQFAYRSLVDGEEGVDDSKENEINDVDLAKGFKRFIPGDETKVEKNIQLGENMVQYKGSVIDVSKLQEKLDKSEKVRAATDLKLIELQKKFNNLKESSDKSDRSRDKLSSDLRDARKKVRGLEDELKNSQSEASKYLGILGDVHNKIKPIVSPPVKTEDIATETLPQINGTSEKTEEKEMNDTEEPGKSTTTSDSTVETVEG